MLAEPVTSQEPVAAWDVWRHDYPPLAVNDNGPLIIGLMGYGGSGKSTVAKILCAKHGFEARHIKAPIAEMTTVLLRSVLGRYHGMARYIDGDLKRSPIPELGGRSATEIQQFIGTELGRDFCYPDLWLDIWLRWADSVIGCGGRVVQESVRFANEAAAVRERGGLIIEVRRPGFGAVNDHKSESLPVYPDAVLDNDGSVADLENMVGELVRRAG